jgi:hypothetical protein
MALTAIRESVNNGLIFASAIFQCLNSYWEWWIRVSGFTLKIFPSFLFDVRNDQDTEWETLETSQEF